jgi:hypothetical protein
MNRRGRALTMRMNFGARRWAPERSVFVVIDLSVLLEINRTGRSNALSI